MQNDYQLEKGLEWATKWGLDTIIGRNRYGLARVAERRGDLAAARAHLDAAAALFERRGARLYLADVEARRREWGL